MRFSKFILLALALMPAALSAQISYDTVSGTIVDTSGHPYANANLIARLVTAQGYPVSSAATPSGQLFNGSPVQATLDATGHFSIGLAPNTILSKPSGTQWVISISAPTDTAILTNQFAWNITYQLSVTANIDLSSQLSALAQPIAFVNLKTNQSTIQGTGGGSPAGSLNSLQTKGSSSFNGGLGSLDPTTGNLSASVNTQFNVQMFGAKGDCSTNDTAAFTSAQTAALAFYGFNSQLPGAIYIPKAPGGCYIVSNWTWKGVALEGQPSGLGPSGSPNFNITLKSLPGQDILHIPDPLTTAGQTLVAPGWSIRNVSFKVDNSSLPTPFSHRWPGRWFDDAAMTNGSAKIVSANAQFTIADVGQAIQVNGAGPSGTNLVTTIASVSPAWRNTAWEVVTLATPASTTVSAAHAYVSILNLPVTQNIGNCAIAEDMQDGNSSHWTGTLSSGNYGVLQNVNFTTTNGANVTNPNGFPCAIFIQGNPLLYGVDAHNLGIYSFWFGIVQAGTELNSVDQPSSGDYEVWKHGLFFFNMVPWVSYNGLAQHLEDLQIAGWAGPQMMQLGNVAFDAADGWTAMGMGIETPGYPTNPFGWRVEGADHNFAVSLTSGIAGQVGYWAASDSTCNCGMDNTIVGGSGNKFYSANQPAGTIDGGGLDNHLYWTHNANPINGVPPNYDVLSFPFKGYSTYVGRFTGDAERDGNGSTPYSNDDLIIWPRDLMFASTTGWSTLVQSDATSPSGAYMIMAPGQSFAQFNQFVQEGNVSNSLVLGSNLPLTGVTVSLVAKCLSGTSFNAEILASSGTSQTQTFSCNTSYQRYSLNHAWVSGDSGKAVSIASATGAGSGTFQAASWQIIPWKASINNKTIPGAGVSIATGPAASVSGDLASYSDALGTQQDSGVLLSSLAPKVSPVFSGTPIAPTGGVCDGTPLQIASEQYVANCGGGLANPMTAAGDQIVGGTPVSGVAPPVRVADVAAGNCWISGGIGLPPVWSTCPGSGSLPSATDTKDKLAVNAAGAASIISPTTDEYNVVLNGGFDVTGITDESTATASLLSNASQPIYFPPGTYNFNSGMIASCTSGTCGSLNIRGAGRGKTIFSSNCANGFVWWLNSSATSGSYWFGPKISGISFKDTSGTGACSSGLRLTQVANLHLEDTEYDNFLGQYYHTGNIGVTNGSKTVTGSGTTFTNAMLQQTNQSGTIGQLILHVNGRPQFVCAWVSATQVTLCDNWEGTTTTTTGANQWDLTIGGTGLLLDGGTNYVQYGMILGTWSSGTLNGIGSVPQQVGSSQGTSRFWIIGGFLNGLRQTDSKCGAFGNFTDTIEWSIACNNAAWGSFWEDSHDNEIKDKVEQDNASTPVYSCNGGVAAQSCTVGIEISAGATSRSYGNSIHDDEVYNYGNALYVASSAASFLTVTNPKWMNSGGASANGNDYNFMGTTGCPPTGNATIIAWNCIVVQSGINAPSATFTGVPLLKTGTASNTDVAGFVTLSSGSGTYSFVGTYISAPVCTANDTTNVANNVKPVSSTATLTLTGTGSDVISYICIGRN